ncbi:MAG TPA: metal-dependent hydrolase [Chitinophagaceae bacterium]|nr:metal-dependent hydrolase [Chitinophagaceae bacterium]
MDSVTHIVLGAAIGEALLGKKIGRKAALIGAFAKTFPDFDLIYTGLSDPRLYMCCHRGHTHSLLWEFMYAFPLAYIFYLLFKKKVEYKSWFILFLVCLWGHSLLDTCTNFGTSLFLPLTNETYAWNNLAIVDLIYTAPMLILLIVGLIYKNNSKGRIICIRSILIYCGIYLGFTAINKVVANQVIKKSLSENNIQSTKFFTNPTILNNILWYGMAVNDSTISVGEFTMLQKDKPIIWHTYNRNTALLDSHPDTNDVKLLKWFSKGYTISDQDGDTLNVYCVKFGRTNMIETELEKTFIFHYKLYFDKGEWQMGMEEPNDRNANMKEGFKDLIKRIQGKQ